MAEYIEREAVLNLCGWYNTVNGKSICAARKDELATLPAADVVEVKHGEWENHPHQYGFVRCSVCHDCNIWGEWADGRKWQYCPNCGADMRPR